MKRNEQIEQMKMKIIQGAIKEFNKHGYVMASMNHICQHAEISKGIIYHYFEDKDELYLACVQVCYKTLYEYYLDNGKICIQNGDIRTFMQLRIAFFKAYPELRGLFFHALLRTPTRLKPNIDALKTSLTNLNNEVYANYLKKLKLREHVNIKKAVLYLDVMQNAYNDYFRNTIESEEDFDGIVQQHEERIPEWIDMMVYGIAEEEF